jgi:hypothetical protein
MELAIVLVVCPFQEIVPGEKLLISLKEQVSHTLTIIEIDTFYFL